MAISVNTFEGSSPHTRGARARNFSVDSESRIIPAYAGSTGQRLAIKHAKADHPRIRGEHRQRGARDRAHAGSSPHTRGARLSLSEAFEQTGIIPAYAGSTTRAD